MKLLRRLCVTALLLFACSTWAQTPTTTPSPDDAKATQLLEQGVALMRAKKPADAVPLFDQVAALYEARAQDKAVKYYSARTASETLFYPLQVATSDKGKSPAVVLSGNWGYAYYLKAYCLLDLGRASEAKAQLLRAVALAPQNAQFLGELGHVYQLEKNWPVALETFERAEKAAKEFSPEQARNGELARAWRGMGYVLVELSRLDEAEAMYRKCLQLNAQDAMAQRELAYVLSQKAKAR
jgi:tetratricopeptide (TPR) repeat protein